MLSFFIHPSQRVCLPVPFIRRVRMGERVLAVGAKHWSPGVSMVDFHMPDVRAWGGQGAYREIEREIERCLANITF